MAENKRVPNGYGLEYSDDGKTWRVAHEKRTALDCPGSGIRSMPVRRDRLQDIQREAEFWSHKHLHVRINHPPMSRATQPGEV